MKFIIKDIREEEDRNVISVVAASRPFCKTCGIKERRDHSSYCEDCANLYKTNNA